ncbi:hypothetical protein HYH02_008642 [Chlamydomonas schloesseri]|uniref:Uncharacterized protein n=1 Tax=Chlamydomonas schloesseri TaxID=2026947 RepID=A0A835WDA3_9CHLO|nr:hypothetical protein HYH02_008642 [Chlamydomonas schloesseri]|eukprot:KAG2445174.1 hypothetical protein HYH02_008642 [Chlamydomonas schloesseri]
MRGAKLLLAAGVLALAAVAHGQLGWAPLTPYVPAESFDTLLKTSSYDERFKQTSLLAELGSSFDGIKFLVTQGAGLIPSLASFASALPGNLTVEPGLSKLALATQAYLALYGGVVNAQYPVFSDSAPINTFKHAAANLVIVNGVPLGNGVSLYSTAIFSLVNGPLLLTLPPYSGGYWLIPFYDAFGEVFHVLGSRQGDTGGRWLLVTHDWEAPEGYEVPEDVKLIRSPTLEGIALGRTSYNGTGAAAWTLSWTLERWGPNPRGADTPDVQFPRGAGLAYPGTDKATLQAVSSGDPWAFWKVAGEVFRRNGGPSVPTPLVKELAKIGLYKDFGFVSYGLDVNTTDALAIAPILATRIAVAKYTFLGTPATNYWKLPVYNGAWGNDYVLAAAIMKGFWISNRLDDAAYYYNYLDAAGQPLSGSNVYELLLPRAPPATSGAFWSVQALDIDRWTLLYGPYPLNTALSSPVAGLYVRPDGSIPIRVQVAAPPANTTAAERGWNWVPGYPGHFHLILRIYAGDATVLSDTYIPPPITKLAAASNSTASGPSPSPAPAPSPSPASTGSSSPGAGSNPAQQSPAAVGRRHRHA